MLTRSSSWPRGMWRAPGMWPASYASLSRTSSTTSRQRRRSSRALHFLHRHERHLLGRLGEQPRHRLAAADVRAQRLGEVGRRLQVERAHHLHELGALALLQARVLRHLARHRRMAATLVVVRRINEQRRIEPQQPAEQAVVQPSGSPLGRSVRPVAPISSVSPVKMRSSSTRPSSRWCARACASPTSATCRAQSIRRRRRAYPRTAPGCRDA